MVLIQEIFNKLEIIKRWLKIDYLKIKKYLENIQLKEEIEKILTTLKAMRKWVLGVCEYCIWKIL
jgi:hypothetical protein